ncbi:MAG: Hsp70 family protein, partial [Brachybacterium sp.]
MRIGIDVGTTRTIAAGADRGNYPVLSFQDPDGDPHDHFPSVIALDGDALVHGFEAERAARAG